MKYLIMCIGNRDGGDDAIGPYIADRLKEDKNLVVLDCGIVPENYTSVVKQHKPSHLIIIDAVDMGLTPGEIRVVTMEKIGRMHISTHGIPLSVLSMYLKEYVDHVILIGIQPKIMTGDMSSVVKKNGDKLVNLLTERKLDQIEKLQ